MTIRILVLDDDTSVRQSLADFLEDHGCTPVAAESAEQALALVAAEPVAAAVVDIRLGGMSGDAFIREANRLWPSLVFVVCTGSPGYAIPGDLAGLPQVSPTMFRKPLLSMEPLLDDIMRLLQERKEAGDE